ncbi:MAG TPA: hypothetical protein VN372_00060 [Methanospirillum sp.]|nr:hypothetical protein [Methanospirillum sp.]
MAEIPLDKPITVITEQNAAICLAELRTDVKHLLRTMIDVEERMRKQEQRNDDCQQIERFDKIEGRLDEGEKRFDFLELKVNSHISSQTATTNQEEKQVTRNREWIILLVGLIGGSFCTAVITKFVEGFFS